MGIIDRLTDAIGADDRTAGDGVEYQCPNCGEVFDEARARCPACGTEEIRERGSFEFRPDERDSEPDAERRT